MSQKIREILERQSELIAKQKKLIRKLNEELQKRNLKTEEVALVLQGVTLGLKNARKWFTLGIFWYKKGYIFIRIRQPELIGHRFCNICKAHESLIYLLKSSRDLRLLLHQNHGFSNEFYSGFAYVC